ncbi:MAG TPA: class I cytochrome c [Sulfuricella sp.]|nr:class I cytochrome c [Sulfuricella sp.]
MTHKVRTSALFGALAASIVFSFSADALAVDADAAITLAKQNGCFKCHNYTKEQQAKKQKDGKPWFEVAAKYKGKADAEAKLIHHITSGEKAKFPDGHEEEHKIIKTTDVDKQKNLVEWILSL